MKATAKRIVRNKSWFGLFCAALGAVALLRLAPASAAELSTGQKRAALANVTRVAIVPAYFGTSTLLGPEPDAKPVSPPKLNAAQEKQQTKYRDYLTKLESAAHKRLPERFAVRTALQIVPDDEIQKALQTLTLTPDRLFQNHGRLRGTRFPAPDAELVRKLAAECHADAVLLDVMDEPRRNNGRVLFDPLAGASWETPDVRSKAAFYLLLRDGTEVLHDFVEALHPVTHGGRDVLLVDWTEAQDTVIEDFMDELTRYTPEIPRRTSEAKP